MKKTVVLVLLAVLLLLGGIGVALAGYSGAEPVKGQLPLLITNAGQGPGGKMARLLVNQSKAVTDFDYNAEPKEADLQARPYKTLMVVIGSSLKGLGASGITIEQELERLEKMIAEAQKLKLQIVAVHLEGKARRGKPGSADERCIDAIAPYANYLIVTKESNEDGRFTRIATEKNIPLTIMDATLDFIQVIKAMYPPQ